MVVGGILAIAGSIALVPHIQFVTDGYRHSFIFVQDSFFWTTTSLIVLGGIAIVGGIVAQFVAWIGAVLNTKKLESKKWFNLMLWSGIVGFVISLLVGLFWWGVMIAYLIAGPEGVKRPQLKIEMPAGQPEIEMPAGQPEMLERAA